MPYTSDTPRALHCPVPADTRAKKGSERYSVAQRGAYSAGATYEGRVYQIPHTSAAITQTGQGHRERIWTSLRTESEAHRTPLSSKRIEYDERTMLRIRYRLVSTLLSPLHRRPACPSEITQPDIHHTARARIRCNSPPRFPAS